MEDGFALALALAEEEEEKDLDDSVASEVDHGIDVAGDDSDVGGEDEPSLDVGTASFDPGIDDGSEDGDDVGPIGSDADGDIGDEEEFDADESEGGTDQLDDFVTADLPGLDAEADMEAGPEEERFVLSTTAEEEEDAPRLADLAWAEVPLPVAMPACTAVAVERGGQGVFGGGAEIFAVDDAGDRRTLVRDLGDPVTSLVPGAEPGAVLFTTEGGELGRYIPAQVAQPGQPGQTRPERLVAFRETTTIAPSRAPEIQLGGPTPSQRPAILLLVREGGGTLLESTDYGTTWRRVELGGSVACLSSGSPPVCLVDAGRATRFFFSEPTGGFSPVGAPYAGESDALSIATHEDVVILLSAGSGVSVSANRGASFETAPGCARATAVTAGRLGPRLSGFAALFDEASGRATLVWIDAATADAFAIATIEPGEDDADDLCRVESLAWDPHTETLWAGGAFGLRRFRRPPSA
jgi:hypothetical protein